jgi:hypothetical protein
MSDQENLENIGRAMMQAWSRVKKAQARMWGEWMTIGEGLLAGRHWAMRQAGTNEPKGKGYVIAFAEWLKRFKVDDMDKSDRAKLLQIMEERPAIEEWRATLPNQERMRLNNPTIFWRKWTAATRVPRPKKKANGKDEQKSVEQLQARLQELQEELDSSREKPQPQGLDDTFNSIAHQITFATADLLQQDLPEFFSRLRQVIDKLEKGEG